MGLMYPFPVGPSEKDHVEITEKKVVLKSYGLPYIFWGYGAAILVAVAALLMAVWNPVQKFLSMPELGFWDYALSYGVIGLFLAIPILMFGFYFYEKRLVKNENFLQIEHRVAGLKLRSLQIPLDQIQELRVERHFDSPNVAKLKNDPQYRAFQNGGFFRLLAKTQKNKIFLDRHSRKADLEKVAKLLGFDAIIES